MASAGSDRIPGARTTSAARTPVATRAAKVLVAGGFGVGKTTLVGSISEIAPLRTEELISELSHGVDDLAGVEAKTTTTVALDFGRITLAADLVLYVFGTPGQGRFWFLWDELADGSLGAVVLADPRRLDGSFAAVDFFERRGVPFVVGVNCFDGAPRYTVAEVRDALDLPPRVPVLLCDARRRADGKDLLLTLTEHVIALATTGERHAAAVSASLPYLP